MLYKMVLTLTTYGSEIWLFGLQDKIRAEVFERMCSENVCGIRRTDRKRNSLRERCECELYTLKIIERNMFTWFGHVEIMVNDRGL